MLLKNAFQSGSFCQRHVPVFVWMGEAELFKNADVTVSICNPSEHVLGSLGIRRGYFVLCVFGF